MASVYLAFVGILFLILISGALATAETAISAASKARLFQMARDGHPRAGKVADLLDQRERLVSSILLGSTLVNAAATSLTTVVLQTLIGDSAVIYATVGITILLLIFAESLPKVLGLARADRVALALGPSVALLAAILNPLIAQVLRIVRVTLRLFHIDLGERGGMMTSSEEIRGTIDLHAQEGGLVKEHKQMLGSILDLDEVLVSDVMVHRKNIEMIDGDLRPEEIVRAAIRSSHTRLPIYRNDPENILGILHAKDLIRALSRRGAEPEQLRIEPILRKPWFVPNTTTLREQLNAFTAQRMHFALVVDEYGALQGLVTLEDILEEIVGEISDEHDLPTPPGVRMTAEGMLEIEGAVTIRDLNRRFDWSLPDQHASTIAGLVINEAQVIPVKGQTFSFFGFVFEILERRRNQITLLKVTPPKPVRPFTTPADTERPS